MKQASHIFAKDIRRFYLEILASVAITLAFVKLYPRAWGAQVDIQLFSWVPTALVVLVMLSWWVLIVRVMHAESLIGDRQFWVTRPYRWGPLLTAKVLFVFTLIVLPFFAAQCLLLREAGFHPFATMPGLLFNTAMAIGIIVLPLMLLASITKNFPKMLLGLFFVMLYGAAIGYASDLLPTSASSLDGSWWFFILSVAAMGAMLAYQYATRRTLVIRLLAVGAGLTVAGFGLFVSGDRELDKVYAERQAGGMTGVWIVVQPHGGGGGVEYDQGNSREVELSLPLGVSGIDAKTAIKADFAKVGIEGPAGQHWESHWQGVSLTWLPGQTDAAVHLKISRNFYQRMKGMPVTVKLSLALTKLQAGTVSSVILPEGEFETPGGSICSIDESRVGFMSCRSALREPALMLVAARPSRSACNSAVRIPGEAVPAVGWIGSLDTDPAEFDLTAVTETTVYFQATSAETGQAGRFLCPGTALGFAAYKPVERGRTTLLIRSAGLEYFTTKMSM